MPSRVLVVVDVQNGFVSSRSAHVVPVIANTVRAWQAQGGPVIFTRFINRPGSPYERLINWTRCRTSPDIDLVDELQPFTQVSGAVVLDKPTYTLFTPQGRALLKQHGWTDLMICGIATESCVCKTAVDAFESGYTPWVLTDATASHAGEEPHAAGLLVTQRFIGRNQMITTTDALEPSKAHKAHVA